MGSICWLITFFHRFLCSLFLHSFRVWAITFIQTIASTQNAIWFVPFVWLGLTLYSFAIGMLLQGLVFLVLSLLFIIALFLLAFLFKPEIRALWATCNNGFPRSLCSKTGLLGKLGFSLTEAAIVRKDLKAFTRRRELMTIFIVPIVLILIPIMQTMAKHQNPCHNKLLFY